MEITCDQIVTHWEGEWARCTELSNHRKEKKINGCSGQTSVSQVSHGKSDARASRWTFLQKWQNL